MAAKKLTKKAIEKKVNSLIKPAIIGVEIPIMDLGRIHDVAEKAVKEGLEDEAVTERVREFVGTLQTRPSR